MGSETIKDAKGEGVQWDHPARSRIEIVDRDRAIVREYGPSGERKTKVNIVGFAGPHRDQAAWNDPDTSIWTLNQLYRHVPRCDRHFEIHKNWDEHVVEGTDHRQWLADCPAPIYMVDRIAGIPNSVKYPRDEVIKALGLKYATSSIAWMIMLALYEDFKEISLFGVDLIVGTEYGFQKPCAEFWLGVAHGQGRSVIIPENCALLKASHDYGFELEPDWQPIKMSMLEHRQAELQRDRDRAFQGLVHRDGMLEAIDALRGATPNPENEEMAKGLAALQAELALTEEQRATLKKYHDATMKDRQQMMTQLVLHDGALANNAFWVQVADLRLKGGAAYEVSPT